MGKVYKHPNWEKLYGYPLVQKNPQGLIVITRHTAQLAMDALIEKLGKDWYNNWAVACNELEGQLAIGD